MSDAYWAAREGDPLLHSSWLSDLVAVLAEGAVYAAAGALLATGVGAIAAAVVVTVAVAATGADESISAGASALGDALFPPDEAAWIKTGSPDTRINGKPAARAAGRLPPPASDDSVQEADIPAQAPDFLDQAGAFVDAVLTPLVAAPAAGATPCEGDKIDCTKHPPQPEQYLAEGSSKVAINSQPAVRSGDRSTCEGTVSADAKAGKVSPNVRIGGEPVVVREIRSGKSGWIAAAATLLSLRRSLSRKLLRGAPCLAVNVGSNQLLETAVQQASVLVATPVHAALGSKFLSCEQELDIDLPASFPLRWQRVYNSRDERCNTVFGVGWSVQYEMEIVHEVGPVSGGSPQYVYTDEQGRRVELGDVAPLAAFHDPALGLAVRRALEGPIVIETLDGTYRIFEQDPLNTTRLRLALIGDRNGNAVRVHYAADGRIEQIAEQGGPGALVLSYDRTHPKRVERIDYRHRGEHIRTLVTYAYSPDGQLAAVRNAAHHIVRRFEYDAGQRLSMHETASGQRCHYEWQAFTGGPDGPHRPHWRVVRYHSNAGDESHFSYDLDARITHTRDNLGRTTTRHWDDDFHVTSWTNEAGATTHFEWNAPGQLVAFTDAEGGVWRLNYDEWGNITEEIDPLGHTEISDYIGFWGLPKHQIDADGNTWRYAYDAHGNLSEEIDPEGQRTQFIHDAQGRLVQSVDAKGQITHLRWNERSLLTDHIDAHGQRTRFVWDQLGQLAQVTDASGETTHYQHDAAGHLIKTRLPDGREYHYQRDRAGLLTSADNPAGHTTTWTRSVTGAVIARQDPAGQRVHFAYDSHGRLLALSNENGQRYHFAWDAADRLVTQTDLDGSQQHYHYTHTGHLTRIEHHPGEADPSPHSEPARPLVTELERDLAGRLTRKRTAESITDYRYNRSGDVLSICQTPNAPAGSLPLHPAHTLRFDYDRCHRLTCEHREHGPLHSRLRHHYDALGHLSATILPDGRRLQRHYDHAGHLSQIHLDDLLITQFSRDPVYRERARTQGHLNTLTHYDRSGRITCRSQHLTSRQGARLPGTAPGQFPTIPATNDDDDDINWNPRQARQVFAQMMQRQQRLIHEQMPRAIRPI